MIALRLRRATEADAGKVVVVGVAYDGKSVSGSTKVPTVLQYTETPDSPEPEWRDVGMDP